MHKPSTFHHLRIYLKSCNSPSLRKRLPRVHHSRVVCASNNTKDLPTKPAVCAAVRPCLLVACGLAPASSSTLTTSADPDIAPNIRAVYCSAINRLHSTLLVARYVVNKEVRKHTTYLQNAHVGCSLHLLHVSREFHMPSDCLCKQHASRESYQPAKGKPYS